MTAQAIAEEQVLAKLAELRLDFPERIEFHWPTMFAKINGWGANKYIRTKHKLILNAAPVLEQMLKPGEQVLHVGKGVYYSLIEQYFLGALVANAINQTVFVLTNLRLIMLHSNSKGKPHAPYWTVYYNQIAKFKGKWTGTVQLKMVDGKSLTFSGFARLDRKHMPQVFERTLELYRELNFNPHASQSQENLCGQCFEAVAKGHYTCETCGSVFWKPRDIALRSLIFPSWGDWIMGHRGVATLELIGYGITWLLILATFGEQQGEPDGVVGAAIVALILLSMAHSGDAFITYMIARKGLHARHAGRPSEHAAPQQTAQPRAQQV
jgi:hypothetical protein